MPLHKSENSPRQKRHWPFILSPAAAVTTTVIELKIAGGCFQTTFKSSHVVLFHFVPALSCRFPNSFEVLALVSSSFGFC